MQRQYSSGQLRITKESHRKIIEESPYSKNFKCYIKSDQRDLLYKRQLATKLSRKELEDKYIDLCDDNFFLKRQNNENLDKIKTLTSKIIRLTEGQRSYSATAILKENQFNYQPVLDRRKGGSELKMVGKALSMSTIFKKRSLTPNDRSKNNSSRAESQEVLSDGREIVEKAQMELSEKHINFHDEIVLLKKKIDDLDSDLRIEREKYKKIEEEKISLETKLSQMNLKILLAENMEINRLRQKLDDFHKVIRRLQEENRKILLQRSQKIEEEKRTSSDNCLVQTNRENIAVNNELLDKINELKSANRIIDIMKKQIAELESDKKALQQQQQSLSELLKEATSFSKDLPNSLLSDFQNLQESYELLKTENAAILNSKSELFNKVRELQDFNDKLLIELEGLKPNNMIKDSCIIGVKSASNQISIVI